MGYFAMTLPPDARRAPGTSGVFSVATVQGERVVSPGLDPSAPDRRARPEPRGHRLLHPPPAGLPRPALVG